MNRREFLKRSLEGIFIGSILLISGCGNNPVSPEVYGGWAHGFWEATSGDIEISNEIGLISYNWYAIDTSSKGDNIFVTWDDGIACTKSSAYMKNNIIEMSVYNVKAEFEIKSNKEAIAYFISNGNSYKKGLTKIRNSPDVLCD